MINEIHARNCMELMGNMPKDCVDLVLTDIPYDVVNRESNGLRKLDKENADIETFNLTNFVDECVRVCKGSIYIFCATEQVSDIRKELVRKGLSTRLIIWEKSNPSPMNGQYIWLSGVECCVYGKKRKATFNAHCRNTVLRYPNGRNKQHPTEKNLELFKELIRVSSNENDLVFDPCCGSGTTAVACEELNRRYICVDINEEYVKIARNRVSAKK